MSIRLVASPRHRQLFLNNEECMGEIRVQVKLTNGIDEDDFSRTIREDPTRKGLLYAGTETGVYVSWDEGGLWQRIERRFPVVPIHDLVVHDKDCVLAIGHSCLHHPPRINSTAFRSVGPRTQVFANNINKMRNLG